MRKHATRHVDIRLLAPVVRGRKGSYSALFAKLRDDGYKAVRIDGKYVALQRNLATDRFVEHDIEVVFSSLTEDGLESLLQRVDAALRMGRGAVMIADQDAHPIAWFSTERTDPATGESYPELDPKHFSWNSAKGWCPCCRGHGRIYPWMLGNADYPEVSKKLKQQTLGEDGVDCPDCGGQRLSAQSRAVRLTSKQGETKNLPELLALTPERVLEFLQTVATDARGSRILQEVLPEISERLALMREVGLEYLSLDRSTNTLSGGEAQRIRLAAQLGSNLSGVLYVLDEPSIGLHARDNDRLLQSLARLRAKNNTLLVVEHDPETMRAADWIIDLGPGAGKFGGELLACGTPEAIAQDPKSLTGISLRTGLKHPMRGSYRALPKATKNAARCNPAHWLVVEQPKLRNLKGGILTLPKGRLIVVCGISGAGKSTLIRDLLKPAVERVLGVEEQDEVRSRLQGLPLRNLRGAADFDKVIEVDQDPIGKTPRSTPATYIGVFDLVRRYFGSLPEAGIRGFDAGSFSFNTHGGRCETCKGAGILKLEMSFMPDSYITCEDCGGRRYGGYAGHRMESKTIADVLDMSFAEAAEFFAFHSRIQALAH
ncbi:MAG: hypothetical protein LR015_02135 [Verrucomicrobia bacterium]|nr:hypothetical protein [Verrucomicrobiota bacterium]